MSQDDHATREAALREELATAKADAASVREAFELEKAHHAEALECVEGLRRARDAAQRQSQTWASRCGTALRERDEARAERDGALIREEWAVAIEKERDALRAEVEAKDKEIAGLRRVLDGAHPCGLVRQDGECVVCRAIRLATIQSAALAEEPRVREPRPGEVDAHYAALAEEDDLVELADDNGTETTIGRMVRHARRLAGEDE